MANQNQRRFRFDSFLPGKERWANYASRLQFALAAHGLLTDRERKTAFIPICSGELYECIASAVYPRQVHSLQVTFAEIMEVLEARYGTLDPSPTMAEQDFLQRSQQQNEPFAVWLADLRRLASFCGFNGQLNGRLKAQLIRGTNDRDARAKLLRKDNYTLDQVIQTLQAYERSSRECGTTTYAPAAAMSAVHMVSAEPPPNTCCCSRRATHPCDGEATASLYALEHRTMPPGEALPDPAEFGPEWEEDVEVFALQWQRRKAKNAGCAGCGARHERAQCPFRRTTCFSCTKVGHIAKVCRSEGEESPPAHTTRRDPPRRGHAADRGHYHNFVDGSDQVYYTSASPPGRAGDRNALDYDDFLY